MACSRSSQATTGSTGPNSSSCITFISSFTSNTSTGARRRSPGDAPGTLSTSRAPFAFASSSSAVMRAQPFSLASDVTSFECRSGTCARTAAVKARSKRSSRPRGSST